MIGPCLSRHSEALWGKTGKLLDAIAAQGDVADAVSFFNDLVRNQKNIEKVEERT